MLYHAMKWGSLLDRPMHRCEQEGPALPNAQVPGSVS
jgi:hypothetical protein